uniref:HDC07393 n=1 Tax=Drosophila melanogaster TaxID=7227 RepID=Q6IG31_DROME|nr:TPA_inf: HDC07393 [Drosophila melanogaster]
MLTIFMPDSGTLDPQLLTEIRENSRRHKNVPPGDCLLGLRWDWKLDGEVGSCLLGSAKHSFSVIGPMALSVTPSQLTEIGASLATKTANFSGRPSMSTTGPQNPKPQTPDFATDYPRPVNGFVLLNRVTPAKVFLARNGLGRVPRALMFEPKDSRIESRAELISQWTMCHRQRRPSLSTQHLPAKNPWATAAAARK